MHSPLFTLACRFSHQRFQVHSLFEVLNRIMSYFNWVLSTIHSKNYYTRLRALPVILTSFVLIFLMRQFRRIESFWLTARWFLRISCRFLFLFLFSLLFFGFREPRCQCSQQLTLAMFWWAHSAKYLGQMLWQTQQFECHLKCTHPETLLRTGASTQKNWPR